ncbi:MAG: hypothetical protein HEP70_00915 [Rhodobiaceae bacterium]|nr:hypothetical protein [Rhodobiaceae bacterium]
MIPKENHDVRSNHPVICGMDLMVLGAAVAHYGRGLDEDVLAALSWAFLNRRATGDGEEFGPAATSSPDWAAALMGDPLKQETARALAVFTRVVAGCVSDPTEGATRFHCHDETPSWAEDMDIRAIVGPYLFYAPTSKDVEKHR